MRRWIVLALAIGAGLVPAGVFGQGPGAQPAKLKDPFVEAMQPPPSGLPYAQTQPTAPAGQPSRTAPAPNQPDPNQDILVTDRQGPWMILVNWYSGQDSPAMARQMVMELRHQYHLPAYVFNRGAEERRKEEERVRGIIEKQKEFFQQKGMSLATALRVKRMHIEEQCAVLVGDYPDDEAARRALNDIRKLKPPDPNRVKLSTMFYQDVDEKTGKVNKQEAMYVNPFLKAFVVRNPLVAFDRPKDLDKADLAVLQKLNRDESLSLLTCKKSYTLVVKQFSTPTAVQPRSASGTFLETLGLGGKTGDGIDTAAHNAHNLAELMRKPPFSLEAYVLHTRFSSLVTVGGFDRPDDPRLRSTQELLTTRLKVPSVMPMPVPR